MRLFLFSLFICCVFTSCTSQIDSIEKLPSLRVKNNLVFDSTIQTIHIFVALCDNKYQGIVPVPAKIGNGQDLNNNLYWGCGFGIKTYFKNSKDWKLVRTIKVDSVLLERLVFKHISKNTYLVADAFNGKNIKECTEIFLRSSAGISKDTLHVNQKVIGIQGNCSLLSYIGHDGLMDFQLSEEFINTDNKKRNCIVLACYSKWFFTPHLKKANVNPLVWTSHLMCPEAYTVYDAITGFMKNESNEQIRTRAALAYSKNQKCSLKAARNLLLTGF